MDLRTIINIIENRYSEDVFKLFRLKSQAFCFYLTFLNREPISKLKAKCRAKVKKQLYSGVQNP